MNKEYIKNHYIPQFILKNFTYNSNNGITYYDLKTKEILMTTTNNVFEVDNLYKDKINYPELPIQVEKDFSVYENEMALLLNGKFMKDDEIVITKEEEESLKLFFALMGFRSIHVYKGFSDSMSQGDKNFCSIWQSNGNFNDFWKRNLGYLVKCRSVKEVQNHQNIDEPIKLFMTRDVNALFGKNIIVCEKRGKTNYVLGDAYPTKMKGDNPVLPDMLLYDLFPISPNRLIMFFHNGLENAIQKVVMFDKKIIKYPFLDSKGNIHIKVQKMYEQDVKSINDEIINCSKYGYIFKL